MPGRAGRNTKRRAPAGPGAAESLPFGGQVWKASWRKGLLNRFESAAFPKDPSALAIGVRQSPRLCPRWPDFGCSKTGGERMVEDQLPSPGCTTAGKELVSYAELRFSLGPLTPTIHPEGAPALLRSTGWPP